MAKVLESFNFSGRGGPRAKHDWAKWLDGHIYALTQEDFHGAKWGTFLVMLRRQAKEKGKVVQAQYDTAAQTLYFKAFVKGQTKADTTPANGPVNDEDEGDGVPNADLGNPLDHSQAAPAPMGQEEADTPRGQDAQIALDSNGQHDEQPAPGMGEDEPKPEPEPVRQNRRGRRG